MINYWRSKNAELGLGISQLVTLHYIQGWTRKIAVRQETLPMDRISDRAESTLCGKKSGLELEYKWVPTVVGHDGHDGGHDDQ